MHTFLKTVIGLVLAVSCVMPAQPSTLDTLKPDHPRVLAHAEDFTRIAKLVKTDPLAMRWYEELQAKGQAMLDEPVARFHIRDGRRLLYVSSEVAGRVKTLAMLYKIDGDRRYLDRIWADLESAASFEHWNPDHFLDVAVMAGAFAIAYDWLHADWTDQQRATLRDAMVRHAIDPGLRAYDNNAWWTRTKINWNQVCNGGLVMAALAIADEEPARSARMIELAVKSLPISMRRYAPDGGYDEGPGYWGFGTSYNILAIASMQTALGHDFGLGQMPGFDVTAQFPVQMTGPTAMAFNFGDGKAKTPRSPILFYFAKQYDQPICARFAAEYNTGSALDLLWYDPQLVTKESPPLPLSAVYESAGVGVLRSAWDNPDAWYVGLKGGAIDHGHAQLDLGSFILESQGVRWLIDLGPDDYNLPGYFESDKMRWLYYRNRAEGHNTLVVNPAASLADQRRDANVRITLEDQTLHADLTPAYTGRIKRALTLDKERDHVQLVDEVAFDSPAELWWFAHTQADVKIAADGRSAVLSRDGKQLVAKLVSPADAGFKLMDASPLPTSPKPEGQNPNNGAVIVNSSPGAHFVLRGQTPRFGEPDSTQAVRKLAIHMTGVSEARIEVVFENLP